MHDDFFVLWRDGDGGAQRGWLRRLAGIALLLGLALGAALAGLQRTIAPDARFEYATTRTYEGVLVGDPVPLLVTESHFHFLVDPLKFAFDPHARSRLTGRRVRLSATLVERGDRTMLEVLPGTVEDLGPAPEGALPSPTTEGAARLRGEIVDSKCYLGVMNPGHLKPHRACAVNCLRGGIPPILLTRAADGTSRQIVLVAGGNRELREWILPFVAEPVEIAGSLGRFGPLEILTVDEGGVRRLR